MALLSEKDRETLSERFTGSLDKDVKVRLFTQSPVRNLLLLPGQSEEQSRSNEAMKVTQELLEELTSISPKLSLEVYDAFGDGADEAKRMGIEQLPAVLLGDDEDGRVRFYGAPVGNEFPTILAGIESLSKTGPMLPDDVIRIATERIDERVHLRVFVTPT